ncbi:hypothetical protein IG631_18728 [Alternaria alternata]|nr:hypothetical protein IG631_18728 [Alternaria alternata]
MLHQPHQSDPRPTTRPLDQYSRPISSYLVYVHGSPLAPRMRNCVLTLPSRACPVSPHCGDFQASPSGAEMWIVSLVIDYSEDETLRKLLEFDEGSRSRTEIVPTNRHTEASAHVYRARLSASLTSHSHPTGSLSTGIQIQHSCRLNVDKTPPYISRLSD